MDSHSSPDTAKPDHGLPPVRPPSGRFIAQLFVIPGLIICVVVLLFLGSTFLVTHEREPVYFLNQLDSDNADIRWRGASDLAQILKRPGAATLPWKADPKFALDLAERLDLAFQRLLKEEKAIGALFAASADHENKHLLWRKLRQDRDLVSFLASALGEFYAPVGAPVLCAIVKYESSPDLAGNTLQRRKALWALINMGKNLKDFAQMAPEQKHDLIAKLKAEALASSGPRADGALTALYYLDKTALPGRSMQGVVKVDETLVATAEAEDRFLRELTAMSFNFWDGDKAEATLLKLASDTGRDTLVRVEEKD
jgi:hypothetical protein